MRGKVIATAAAVLIALAAGWYLGSPWWTLWRMREAARAGDLAGLASYIDVPVIERRAKAEAKTAWSSLKGTLRGDSEGDRNLLALARKMLAGANGIRFRPAEMREWLAGTTILGGGDRDPYVVHQGLDRFEVRYRGSSLEYGPVLSFRRHGLGWKLEWVRWGQQ